MFSSDLNDLPELPGVKIEWPDPEDIMNFQVQMTPNDGYWKGATFDFTVSVPKDYPHVPPKCLCKTLVCRLITNH